MVTLLVGLPRPPHQRDARTVERRNGSASSVGASGWWAAVLRQFCRCRSTTEEAQELVVHLDSAAGIGGVGPRRRLRRRRAAEHCYLGTGRRSFVGVDHTGAQHVKAEIPGALGDGLRRSARRDERRGRRHGRCRRRCSSFGHVGCRTRRGGNRGRRLGCCRERRRRRSRRQRCRFARGPATSPERNENGDKANPDGTPGVAYQASSDDSRSREAGHGHLGRNAIGAGQLTIQDDGPNAERVELCGDLGPPSRIGRRRSAGSQHGLDQRNCHQNRVWLRSGGPATGGREWCPKD